MAGEPAKKEKKPYAKEMIFSVLKLAPSFPPPLPVGTADVGLSGIPADLLHSHGSGKSEAWHSVGNANEPGFVNSWVNFDGVRPVQFKRVHGFVMLRGIWKNGTIGSTVFTLPPGFRPTILNQHFGCAIGTGGVNVVRISDSGVVADLTGQNTWTDAAIIFRGD